MGHKNPDRPGPDSYLFKMEVKSKAEFLEIHTSFTRESCGLIHRPTPDSLAQLSAMPPPPHSTPTAPAESCLPSALPTSFFFEVHRLSSIELFCVKSSSTKGSYFHWGPF
ncbi:unnamed protein product [Rangifer tarandus platyrhynchus]|uniref:Uncharacterized protein n=1 Tax=Rangifer tarandus platyrhynchus TaxID=3082113 RepID=A0AC59ZZC4_RANTA